MHFRPSAAVALLLAATLAALAIAPPRARAQQAPGPTGLSALIDTTGHAADSLRKEATADSLRSLGLPVPEDTSVHNTNPFRYASTYNINRSSSNWTQALTVNTIWHGITVNNTTNLTFRDDLLQKKRSATRRSDMTLNYLAPMGINVGVVANLQRDNDGPIINGVMSPTSDYNSDAGRISLSKQLKFSAANALSFSLDGGGTGRDENTGARRTGGGSDLGESMTWDFKPATPFHMTVNGARSVSNGSETGSQQNPTTGLFDTTTVKTTNKSLTLGTQSGLNLPWHSLTATFNGSYANSQQQQPTLGLQETLRQKTANADAAFNADVAPKLKTSVTLHADLNRVLSDVDSTSNYDTRTSMATGELNFNNERIGSAVMNISSRTSINDFRARPGGNLQNMGEHNVSLNLQRDLGSRFQLKLTAAGRLDLTRYDDPIAKKLNTDFFNRRIGGNLDIRPGGFLPVKMTLQASQSFNHNVYLDPSQSAKSSTDALYSVEYDIGYTRTRITLTQSYVISADANISDFENYPGVQADNRYTKSLNYITALGYQLTERVRVDADNNLRTTRSGSYDLDPVLLQRLFGEANRSSSNVLGVKVGYKIADWISLFVGDRGTFSDQEAVITGGSRVPTSWQKSFEYNTGLNVKYKFTRWGDLAGNFSRSSRVDRVITYVNGVSTSDRTSGQDFFVISSSFNLVF